MRGSHFAQALHAVRETVSLAVRDGNNSLRYNYRYGLVGLLNGWCCQSRVLVERFWT